jgi:hypothetical protein
MDVLMELQDTHIEGALGKEFVMRGLCPELSLGYHVTMSKSPAGFLRASNKKVIEVSIVRQGARNGCKIRAFSNHAANKTVNKISQMLNGSNGKTNHAVSDAKRNSAAGVGISYTPSAQQPSKRHKILI